EHASKWEIRSRKSQPDSWRTTQRESCDKDRFWFSFLDLLSPRSHQQGAVSLRSWWYGVERGGSGAEAKVPSAGRQSQPRTDAGRVEMFVHQLSKHVGLVLLLFHLECLVWLFLVMQSEAEKLQRLKERVETQEAKLKKIRAMRGQVDYSKLINGNLSAEIDHVSSLFQEKQAELQSAVIRVDQARNRHNLEQSSKLVQNKELLNKRNAQVTVMDQRIRDLRERLHKKKAELSRMNGGGPSSPQTSTHPCGGVSGRVAAVCPYIQTPAEGRQDPGYPVAADPPPKPTPLNHVRSLSGCLLFTLPVGHEFTLKMFLSRL
ncbi:hypothetical protein XENOCAPTIV_010102, partial [Xenoophorus captivus]